MGNAVGQKVDDALVGIFEGGKSTVNIGLGKTSYCATDTKLCSFRLAENLVLAGGISKIKVSTNTIGGGVAAVRGVAPPLDIELEGVRIRISGDDGTSDAKSPASAKKNADHVQNEVRKYLPRLSLSLKNFEVQLSLGGYLLIARVAVLKATPTGPGRSASKWKIMHTGIRLELDGRELVVLSDASAEVVLAQNFRRVDANLETAIKACLDVDQLLALLDIIAAAVAIGALEASASPPDASSAACSNVMPCGVIFGRASLQLDMLGSLLLSAVSKSGKVAVTNSSAEVLVTEPTVEFDSSAAIVCDEMAFQVKDNESRFSLIHGFPCEEGQMPWQSVADLLLDDPRFATHQAWLECVHTNSGVSKIAKKRAQIDDDGPDHQKFSRTSAYH